LKGIAEGDKEMDQLPETIACPYCGNINPYMQENCMKCKKPLGPIRAAMQSGTWAEQAQMPPKPIEPAPAMPDLPKGTVDKIKYLGRKSFLIRGMGDKNIEIAARFFKRLNEKDLKDVSLSTGQLGVEIGSGQQETRDYYFVRKNLDIFTYLLMAIRIAPSGPDLYVEWRHYFYRKLPYKQWWWWLVLALGFIGVFSIDPSDEGWIWVMSWLVILVGIFGGLIYTGLYSQNNQLKGFQLQENEIFQLSVRATLEEAIDLAGIPKSLIQNNSMDENKERII